MLKARFSFGHPADIGQTDPLFTVRQSTLIALSNAVDKEHIDIDPVEKQLIHPERISKATQMIKEAINPKVASFLLSRRGFKSLENLAC